MNRYIKIIKSVLPFFVVFSLYTPNVNAAGGYTTASTNNYYNMLLDDESAVKFRRGVHDYANKQKSLKFTAKTTIGEVINYPTFEKYSHLLLPTSKTSDLSLHLDELANIMAIHHSVSLDNTLESLDYIASQEEEGNQVYFPIYSTSEIKDNPDLKNTGMFFFRGKPNAPFAIVVPGGYSYRSIIHEGFPVALRIIRENYNVFVLSYRADNLKTSSDDLVRAINLIINNANSLKVSPDKYSLWGAAVGAQIVLNVVHSSYKNGKYADDLVQRPSVDVLSYPLSFYPTKADVPTVIAVGERDNIVNKTILKSSIKHLNELGIESKYISLPRLQHGFGVGFNRSSSVSINWVGRAVTFWEDKAGFESE